MLIKKRLTVWRRRDKKHAAGRPAGPVPPPPPAALVLVAAAYEDSNWVRLTFDRPIDAAGLDPAAITVVDSDISGTTFRGAGPGTLVGPATVQVELAQVGPATGSGTLLTAGSDTNIVAVGDGGAWPGVANLPLPFGQ